MTTNKFPNKTSSNPIHASVPRGKAMRRARLALFILMPINFVLISLLGMIWAGFGAEGGAFGVQEWGIIAMWAALAGAMVFSFIKPIQAYVYFFVELIDLIAFWIFSGDFEIPVFFLITLMIAAIPYLIFLREHAGHLTKKK